MEILYVNDIDFTAALNKLSEKIITQFPELNATNTLVLMVSPDYSANTAMYIAHELSKDGEMCDILPIHIPYPDESSNRYIEKAKRDIDDWYNFSETSYDNCLLVESGVIKGSTYTWLTNVLKEKTNANIVTAALFENINSKFKSDIVSEYYDAESQDLTFYFEKENKHWS